VIGGIRYTCRIIVTKFLGELPLKGQEVRWILRKGAYRKRPLIVAD
jgi:hypothetical protein